MMAGIIELLIVGAGSSPAVRGSFLALAVAVLGASATVLWAYQYEILPVCSSSTDQNLAHVSQ